VVGLGSVLAPIVLSEFVRTRRRPAIRAALGLGVLLLVVGDTSLAARSRPAWMQGSETPGWVEWLKNQPASVRLAAFCPPGQHSVEWWGLPSLQWLPMHGHGTLCGGAFSLLEGDLRLLGASYERINPAGLRFVVSLGYEALAFHREYLATNSWITALPWLEQVDDRGEWLICRARRELARMPEATLEEVLDQAPNHKDDREAPVDCWITGSWPVGEDTLVRRSEAARLAWSDERGRLVTRPQVAFYQHVFGPGMPAYCVRTPARPGMYRLVVLDQTGRRRASIPHRIVADLAVSQRALPARRPEVTVHTLAIPRAPANDRPASLNLTLVNTSTRYLLSQVFREHLDAVSRTHPGLKSDWPQASAGAIVLKIGPIVSGREQVGDAREIPLPGDLPPGGRLTVAVPADRLPPEWSQRALEIEPAFTQVGQIEAAPQSADLKIFVDVPATQVAGSGASTGDDRAARFVPRGQRRR
jgi:hypothetical protein